MDMLLCASGLTSHLHAVEAAAEPGYKALSCPFKLGQRKECFTCHRLGTGEGVEDILPHVGTRPSNRLSRMHQQSTVII